MDACQSHFVSRTCATSSKPDRLLSLRQFPLSCHPGRSHLLLVCVCSPVFYCSLHLPAYVPSSQLYNLTALSMRCSLSEEQRAASIAPPSSSFSPASLASRRANPRLGWDFGKEERQTPRVTARGAEARAPASVVQPLGQATLLVR